MKLLDSLLLLALVFQSHAPSAEAATQACRRPDPIFFSGVFPSWTVKSAFETSAPQTLTFLSEVRQLTPPVAPQSKTDKDKDQGPISTPPSPTPSPSPVPIRDLIQPTRDMYEEMDENKDGTITAREYMRWLQKKYNLLIKKCIESGETKAACEERYQFIKDMIDWIRSKTSWFDDPDLFPNYRCILKEIEDGLKELDIDGDGILQPEENPFVPCSHWKGKSCTLGESRVCAVPQNPSIINPGGTNTYITITCDPATLTFP